MGKFPDLNYQINDLGVLENDLAQALQSAVRSVEKKSASGKRKAPGFDYGFVCGYVEGNLNAVWYNEYIYKQSNNYKVLAAITTLDDFLRADDLVKIRLSSVYSEYYKSQMNVEDADVSIKVDLPVRLGFLDVENSDNHVLAALENIKIDLVNKNFIKKIPDFLDTATAHFTSDEIGKLLVSWPGYQDG